MKKFEISFVFETYDDDWNNEDVKDMVENVIDPIYHLGDVFVDELNVEQIGCDIVDKAKGDV